MSSDLGVLQQADGLGAIRPSGRALVSLTANQFFTDWREYPTNLRPAGWTFPHDQPPAVALRVAGLPSAAGGRCLEWGFAGGSRDRYTVAYSSWPAYDGSVQAQDQEIYGEFEVTNPSFTSDGTHSFLCGLMSRAGGSGTSETGFRLVLHQLTVDSSRSLTLNAYTGGAYDQLADVPFAWQVGVTYCLRLSAVGARLRGKVWAKAGVEPVGWLIDFTLVNATHLAYKGPPGLQFHEGSEARCLAWGAALRGEVAPSNYPRVLPRAQSQWLYTFDNDGLGAVPQGFTSLFQDPGGRFQVVADAGAPSGRALEFTGQAGARGLWGLALSDLGAVGDVDLYAELKVSATALVPNARFGGLIARAKAAGGLWTGWGNDSRCDTSGNLFAASNYDRWLNSAGSTTLTGDSGFTATAGLVKDVWTCLRLRVIKHQFFARYWPRGQAEPSGWFRTTDLTNLVPTATAATGLVGIFTQEDRTMRWGCVGVGLDGTTAPGAS